MVALLAGVLLALGCAEAREPSARPSPAASPSATTKSKIPIRVRGGAQTAAGVPVSVEIELTALSATDSLEVEFRAGDGLEIVSGATTVRYGAWAVGEGAVESLTVVSEQPGTAYVYVHLHGRFEGYERGSAYGIAIAVGGAAGAARKSGDAPIALDEEGQLLIRVPGERR
jgi:hypothetical protein